MSAVRGPDEPAACSTCDGLGITVLDDDTGEEGECPDCAGTGDAE